MLTAAQKAAKAAAATTPVEKTTAEKQSEAVKNRIAARLAEFKTMKVKEVTEKLVNNKGKKQDYKLYVWEKDGEKLYAQKTFMPPGNDAFLTLEKLAEKVKNKPARGDKGDKGDKAETSTATAAPDKVIKLHDNDVLKALLHKLTLEDVQTFINIASTAADVVIEEKKTAEAIAATNIIKGLDYTDKNVEILKAALAELQKKTKKQ